MFTLNQIKTHLRTIPPPLRFGAAGFIVLLVVLLLFSHRGATGAQAPSAEPAAQLKLVAAPPASHATASAKPPAAQSVVTPTSPTAAALTADDPFAAITPASLMLPAQPAPANLVRGTSARTLSAAPMPTNYTVELPTAWTLVAEVVEQTPTASWKTAPSNALEPLYPSEGFVNNTWTMWMNVADTGQYTLVYRQFGGTVRSATVTIDGGASPAIDARRGACFNGPCGPDSLSVANANLAAGWHQITVTVIQRFYDESTGAELFLRGPADSMPVAIVPFGATVKVTPTQVTLPLVTP